MGFHYKYRYISVLSLFLVCLFVPNLVLGQSRLRIYEEYIDKYSDIAVRHMNDYNIPASVTLAQGLLESGAGMSDLARQSNNHFGIKCHRDWRGESVYAADDTPNDCFRKYRKVEDSFEDHAQFLTSGGRYRELFDLSITDYKGWARGLQKTGYATDRAYANKLIKLIEDYELYRFDNKNYRKGVTRKQEVARTTWTHQPYKTHGLVYVIAVNGDSFAGIANEFGFKEKDLLKFNEVPEGFPLSEGDIVYFQKKKSRADKPYFEHVVQIGESMYSISQKYGIQLRNLYRLNKKSYEYVPEEGDVLRLR
ncbi:MAG TPA: LysM peptidoglycan-binding domain-containing protein [Petrimonas sp.]|uniref:glucosaminidase domain-containing protein n=1 Tax=Petrimonas sp. TaxID=2023866 RepID=UPI00095C283D|nr:glucosaminidase domain-containing protein [Petrimonas sp.]OJV35249.1 MAG: N-acetylmuramoyl-L-alanine amidase [Bacteroidia bacterium 43-41]MEA4948626.1 glucosaminidase domain-containing protein [Petrimonas sp.]MEA4979356.1 glucosaminidase domain-containing protein [Petrimonas sp.]MEA5043443.1 glucosaminidase domain-containing protein [Petrimonas sp.]